ncbi:Mu transposase C-terminal domain-containing protein [Pseudoalteromonas luteoviolacea]|uniref:Transcriptional antiterminator n=1 Tax=Pseudoalteromonas luteoviolacea H33 TaxID=1365251 RepID=A0A167CHR7_9GAMM|nr:Mu transposase C-terminal domain-containing protein [Pseudoalteromonas luteoviolacea]KZN47675.1 transcriptional antiterminator [Pseudoalteromonas luteoviolacea H33]KZN75710.1 transcriptional antiterminator [Pseudoalteromonas luteoviolacea H33-S]
MFQINEVLQYDQTLYRVLMVFDYYVLWIKVHNDKAFPEFVEIAELEQGFQDEVLTRTDDPYSDIVKVTPEFGSTAQIKRDDNYAAIRPLVELEDCYEPKARGRMVNQIVAETGKTKQSIYRFARRYWQRGQVPNALLPDYKNSGAKGQKRRATTKKLGRPRKYMPGIGALIDDFTEKLFRIAIERHVLTDKGKSFTYAHNRLKDIYTQYFPELPESELPTYWQMEHFYKREYRQVEKIEKQAGDIKLNKDIRPLTGTAAADVLGPGMRYEIDATIADIYLVSDTERGNIVGRPVIYMVIDVFSRMVAGFYIGFENPSYAAAIQALHMASTDKSEYCREQGFKVSPEQWPCIGLPSALLADRGELMGHQIECLEKGFGVRLENTPPFRSEAKGVVERSFRTFQQVFKPFSPGVVTGSKIKKHGERDYRLDAKLTIKEFTKIILASVLYHNQYHVMKDYDKAVDMPTDLPNNPLAIWNWGLQHRTGRLRKPEAEHLRVALMPRTRATISDSGVCIFGVYYTSAELLKLGWMHRGKEVKRPKTIEVAYDLAIADYIYLYPDSNKNEYFVCQLATRSRQFSGASFWDVWQQSDELKQTHAEAKLIADERKRALERQVIEVVKLAEKAAPKHNGLSDAERIRNIRGNRAEEKDKERKAWAYKPVEIDTSQSAEVHYLAEPDDDLDFPDFSAQLFKDDEDS